MAARPKVDSLQMPPPAGAAIFPSSRPPAIGVHPNELDRRRIQRALKSRRRYRYVKPDVFSVPNGYEIKSPCCSRNVDPDGGVVDIARLEFQSQTSSWTLYRKDHRAEAWVAHGEFPSLPRILELLNEDPERRFWQ